MTQFSGGKPAPASTPRMGPDLVAQLMIYLLRHPMVGSQAAAMLKPEHFTSEPPFRIAWQAVLSLKSSYPIGTAPFDALYLTASEASSQPSARIDDAGRAALIATDGDVGKAITADLHGPVVERPGIIWHAYFAEDPAALDDKFGLELLRRFLHERVVVDRTILLTAGAEERVPGNFEAALAEVRTDLTRIGSIGRSIQYRLDEFPDDPEPVDMFTTGVGYMDEMLGGGQVGGEMYMLFGPYKGGKTFAAAEVTHGTAEYFHLLAQKGGPEKYAAYFSYELTGPEMARRFRSRGADISLTRLEGEIRSRSDYSIRGKLLAYEQDLYQKKGLYDMGKLPGELERLQRYTSTVGKHVALFDMLNVDGADVGAGGIDEVVAQLSQMVLEGKTPGMVVIDNIYFAANRTVNARGGEWDKIGRGEVSAWVTKSITHIARKFKVPVWLLHQYNADANQLKPGKRPRATQSAESRTVGAHANMLFCLGARDEATNVAQIVLDLSRRGKNGGMRKLIQLEGDLSRWHDVTDGFEIVQAGEDEGRIVQKVKASVSQIDPNAAVQLAKAASAPKPSPDPYAAAKELGFF